MRSVLRTLLTMLVAAVVLAGAAIAGHALGDARRPTPAGEALAGGSPSPAPMPATPIPWAGRVAPSWTVTTPKPLAGIRACSSADLAYRANWTAAAGTTYTTIGLANGSATPCQLTGRPDVVALDHAGRVVAARRPDVPDWWPAPVLLEPGHTTPPSEPWTRPGDAFLSVEWVAWCGDAIEVSTLRVPLSGGWLRVDLPPLNGATSSATVMPSRCDLGAVSKTPSLLPEAFIGTTPPPTPTPPLLVLAARIAAPTTIAATERTLHYTVTLTNMTASTYSFSPCPIFTEQFVKNLGRYYLPCDVAASLAPGAAITFAVELALDPRLTPPGESWQLSWSLEPRLSSASASVGITVLPAVPGGTPAPKPVLASPSPARP